MNDAHDTLMADLIEKIDRFGWAIRHVLGIPDQGVAPFSYTVGLTYRGLDELVITGLPIESAEGFIAVAVEAQSGSFRFRADSGSRGLTDSGEVWFIRVTDKQALTAATEVLGEFDALQIVWPDSKDRLPWTDGYANRIDAQPLLGASLLA